MVVRCLSHPGVRLPLLLSVPDGTTGASRAPRAGSRPSGTVPVYGRGLVFTVTDPGDVCLPCESCAKRSGDCVCRRHTRLVWDVRLVCLGPSRELPQPGTLGRCGTKESRRRSYRDTGWSMSKRGVEFGCATEVVKTRDYFHRASHGFCAFLWSGPGLGLRSLERYARCGTAERRRLGPISWERERQVESLRRRETYTRGDCPRDPAVRPRNPNRETSGSG